MYYFQTRKFKLPKQKKIMKVLAHNLMTFFQLKTKANP